MRTMRNTDVLVGVVTSTDLACGLSHDLLRHAIDNGQALSANQAKTVTAIRERLQRAVEFAVELERRINEVKSEGSKLANSQLPPPTGDK